MDCPCYLTIDLSNCKDDVETIITELGSDYSLGQRASKESNEDDSKQTYKVKKGLVNICTISGRDHMQYHEHNLIIPEGKDCDPIMAQSSILKCDKDNMTQIIFLHKQYALLHIEMFDGNEKPFPYKIRIKGNVKGFSLFEFGPVSGDFITMPSAEGDLQNIFEVNVPRQNDDSLSLELYDDAELIDTIPIGKQISAQGYSWTDEDLNDISLKIDYSRAEVRVTVLPWENEKEEHVSL